MKKTKLFVLYFLIVCTECSGEEPVQSISAIDNKSYDADSKNIITDQRSKEKINQTRESRLSQKKIFDEKYKIHNNDKENKIHETKFMFTTVFLQKLNALHKYNKEYSIESCNHDEKDHTDEELELEHKFSRAILHANNKLRTNPEYFLEKIRKKRNYIVKNLDEKSKHRYLKRIEKEKIEGTLYITNHYEEMVEGVSAYDEAIAYLEKNMKTLKLLKPYKHFECLMKSSLLHAKATSKHNFQGHRGICWPVDRGIDKRYSTHVQKSKINEQNFTKNFRSVSNRLTLYWKKSKPGETTVGENLHYGSIDAEDYRTIYDIAESVIIDLFVDDGVADRGHRKNLLNNKSTHLGSAIYRIPANESHNYDRYVVVMNFASGM